MASTQKCPLEYWTPPHKCPTVAVMASQAARATQTGLGL